MENMFCENYLKKIGIMELFTFGMHLLVVLWHEYCYFSDFAIPINIHGQRAKKKIYHVEYTKEAFCISIK